MEAGLVGVDQGPSAQADERCAVHHEDDVQARDARRRIKPQSRLAAARAKAEAQTERARRGRLGGPVADQGGQFG